MDVTRTYPLDASSRDATLAEVALTRAALRHARQSHAQLAEVRSTFTAAADALDAALGAARASGAAGRPLVRDLLTSRDLLIWV